MTSQLALFDSPRRSSLDARQGTVRRFGEDYPATLLTLAGRDVGYVYPMMQSLQDVGYPPWIWVSTCFHNAGHASTVAEGIAAVEAHLVTCVGPALSWAPPPRRTA